jgi:hypothetical protein
MVVGVVEEYLSIFLVGMMTRRFLCMADTVSDVQITRVLLELYMMLFPEAFSLATTIRQQTRIRFS